MLTEDERSKLKAALMEAAVGGSYEETVTSVEVDERQERKGGTVVSTERSLPPNPELIMKMLGEGIGGPQDYC